MTVARLPARLVFLALWLVCLVSAPVRSQDSTNEAQSATDLAQEKNRQQRQSLPFAKGTLTDIDFQQHALRVKTVDGVRTFIYTPRTYIFRDKVKITIDKLKVGEVIALRFRTENDGTSTIIRIKAYGTPTADAPQPGPATATNQLPSTAP
jgi:hypothetical protein